MAEGRLRSFIGNHRGLAAVVLTLVVALGIFVVTYFEPHKLFIDETVDEAFPEPTATGVGADSEADNDGGGSSTRARAQMELASGPFHGLEHDTSGTAFLLELADGRRFLRFEDFETSNGPDLRVYLSEIPAGDDWFVYGERFVDLGALKGNVGNQNYEIPDDVDLDKYVSAVVWCRQFSVGFGVAPLEAG
ncbi:MAG: DM13 domain-containing protein [Actinomycetota bacterium]